jgi:hypothetical protein
MQENENLIDITDPANWNLYVGRDGYVTYEVFRKEDTTFSHPMSQSGFHIETNVNGWFGNTFFRTPEAMVLKTIETDTHIAHIILAALA